MATDHDHASDIDFLLGHVASLEVRIEKLEAATAPKPAPVDPDPLPAGQYRDFSGSVRYESGGYVPDPELLAIGEEQKRQELARPPADFDREGLSHGQFKWLGTVYSADGLPVANVEANRQRIKDAMAKLKEYEDGRTK